MQTVQQNRNFNHLYYFYIVAKLGGVTAAARQLNTSQSSLSTQLKTLEKHIDQVLFQKVGRKLVLTRAGHRVFSYCRRMFDAAGELDAFLLKSDQRGHASFALGVAADIERPFITDVLSRTLASVREEHKPFITQLSYPHETLAAKLEVAELDAVISSQPIHSSSARSVLDLKLAVKAIASPQLGRSVATLLENDSIGLVLAAPDMKIRWETDDYLLRKRIRKSIAFESNVMGAILRAVIDGFGVGFLPEAYVTADVHSGRLIISKEKLWTHRLFLSTRHHATSDEGRFVVSTLAEELVRAATLTKS